MGPCSQSGDIYSGHPLSPCLPGSPGLPHQHCPRPGRGFNALGHRIPLGPPAQLQHHKVTAPGPSCARAGSGTSRQRVRDPGTGCAVVPGPCCRHDPRLCCHPGVSSGGRRLCLICAGVRGASAPPPSPGLYDLLPPPHLVLLSHSLEQLLG